MTPQSKNKAILVTVMNILQREHKVKPEGKNMTQFIPLNEERNTELRQGLSTTMFQSPENFVEAYNKGWINRSSEDIIKILDAILDTYIDVKKSKNQIVFISQSEIFIDEINKKIQAWKTVVTIKTELRRLLDKKALTSDDSYYVEKDGLDYAYYIDKETGEERKLTTTKLFSDFAEADRLLRVARYANQDNEDENKILYSIERTLSIDASFAQEVNRMIP